MSASNADRSADLPRAAFGPARKSPRRFRLAAGLAGSALVLLALAFLGTGFAYGPYETGVSGGASDAPDGAVSGPAADLTKARSDLLARLQKLAPRGLYIVIDQTHNRLYLREKERALLDAVCSCGSGIVLSHGTKEWVFDTPPGIFRVNQKIEDPVWRKPDWAFIEEGKPVPRDASERFEYDMMGEYALGFGNSYFIHGTLYERLLGRSVTHGCIRLGRADLRELYRQAHVGTPIYIF
jgi:L,D-transpeptidase YbiS